MTITCAACWPTGHAGSGTGPGFAGCSACPTTAACWSPSRRTRRRPASGTSGSGPSRRRHSPLRGTTSRTGSRRRRSSTSRPSRRDRLRSRSNIRAPRGRTLLGRSTRRGPIGRRHRRHRRRSPTCHRRGAATSPGWKGCPARRVPRPNRSGEARSSHRGQTDRARRPRLPCSPPQSLLPHRHRRTARRRPPSPLLRRPIARDSRPHRVRCRCDGPSIRARPRSTDLSGLPSRRRSRGRRPDRRHRRPPGSRSRHPALPRRRSIRR